MSLSGNAKRVGDCKIGLGVFYISESKAQPAEAQVSVGPRVNQNKLPEPPPARLCSLGQAQAALG